MRRYIALILALVMCLSLCACGAKAEAETVPVKAAVPAPAVETAPDVEATEPVEADAVINNADEAIEAARREIAVMQEMGLLSEEITMEGEPDFTEFFPVDDFTPDEYWAVRWYGGRSYINDWQGGNKYSVALNLDPASGKITWLTIEASGDEDDEATEKVSEAIEFNPETGEDVTTQVTWVYYENYSDIVPEGLTVGGFCTLLAEYLGYEGVKLCSTKDYDYDIEAPDADLPFYELADIDPNYYLTVQLLEKADDTDGEERYIQLGQFPARVFLSVGNSHAKG